MRTKRIDERLSQQPQHDRVRDDQDRAVARTDKAGELAERAGTLHIAAWRAEDAQHHASPHQ
jgi:hypothetical protein